MDFEIGNFLHLDKLPLFEFRHNLRIGVGFGFLDDQQLLLCNILDRVRLSTVSTYSNIPEMYYLL